MAGEGNSPFPSLPLPPLLFSPPPVSPFPSLPVPFETLGFRGWPNGNHACLENASCPGATNAGNFRVAKNYGNDEENESTKLPRLSLLLILSAFDLCTRQAWTTNHCLQRGRVEGGPCSLVPTKFSLCSPVP